MDGCMSIHHLATGFLSFLNETDYDGWNEMVMFEKRVKGEGKAIGWMGCVDGLT
jgi:hypothetical protein